MHAHAFAQAAYGQVAVGIKTPRDVEYEAFARITARLKSAMSDLPCRFADLAQTLAENRRLWTELASDVAQPDNGLPLDTRIAILNLAQFTITHSSRVLGEGADATPLLDINLAIMKGLSPKDNGA